MICSTCTEQYELGGGGGGGIVGGIGAVFLHELKFCSAGSLRGSIHWVNRRRCRLASTTRII
jgi:hypothetical protein